MNYGFGTEFSGWTTYPFPIFVSRSFPEVGGDEVFAAIPDPKISEVGGKWESVFADPKYPDHLMKVKLVKVASTPWERIENGFYDYEASVSLSWDNGKSWTADSPPWPTAYIKMQAEAQNKGSMPK
ncbi:MAG: hypothetical protein Q7S70_00655 [bacterium]|nr:hypothetical protein [bacterium]